MAELLLAVAVFLLIVYVTKEFLRRFNPKLPPGPWGLPVLGYAPFLGECAYEEYFKLSKKYGPVFGFHYGSRYMVVLGDYASIKEAYNKDEFQDRPGSVQKLIEEPNIFSVSGWHWKETRRFLLSTFRTLGMGKNKLEERIMEEVSTDIQELEKLGPDAEIKTEDFFNRSFANNIFSIISGIKFDDSENVLSMTKRFKETVFTDVSVESLKYHFPALLFYYGILSLFGMKKNRTEEMNSYLRQEIVSHEKEFDPENKEDFFDYYIEEVKKRKEEKDSSFTELSMLGNAKLALLAGTETTQVTMDWAMLCLAKYPEIQEKMYKQITELLGKEKPPSWNDRDTLTYTSAFIMEVHRFRTPAPASDPHFSTESGTVAGYHIPKGTILLANIFAVHNDQKLWGDPENFRPDRFLGPGGKINTPEYLMPFLIGKRMCPGEKLASMQVFLFVASIVQKFKVLPPKSGLCMEGKNELMFYAVKPVVSFQRRA